MINILLCLVLVSGLDLDNVKQEKTVKESDPVLKDILEHTTSNYYHELPMIRGHELIHDINAQYTNAKPGYYALYVGQGKIAYVKTPNIKLSQISEFLTDETKGSRYNTYFKVNGPHHDHRPLYIFDEWMTYIVSSNIKDRDILVDGPIEFIHYGLALCEAVKKYDPEYFKTNTQFREFVRYGIEKAFETPCIKSRCNYNFSRPIVVEMFGEAFYRHMINQGKV